MKYRSIKTPPVAGSISVKDAVRSAKTVARSTITGRFVNVKRANPRTVIITKVVRTSPATKVKKSSGKTRAGATLSKPKVATARKR